MKACEQSFLSGRNPFRSREQKPRAVLINAQSIFQGLHEEMDMAKANACWERPFNKGHRR